MPTFRVDLLLNIEADTHAEADTKVAELLENIGQDWSYVGEEISQAEDES